MHTANNFSISLFVMFGLQSSTSSPTLYDTVTSIIFLIILGAVLYYITNKTDFLSEIEENRLDA